MKKVHALMWSPGNQHFDDNNWGDSQKTLYVWSIDDGPIVLSEVEPKFDPQTGEELETGDPIFDYSYQDLDPAVLSSLGNDDRDK